MYMPISTSGRLKNTAAVAASRVTRTRVTGTIDSTNAGAASASTAMAPRATSILIAHCDVADVGSIACHSAVPSCRSSAEETAPISKVMNPM